MTGTFRRNRCLWGRLTGQPGVSPLFAQPPRLVQLHGVLPLRAARQRAHSLLRPAQEIDRTARWWRHDRWRHRVLRADGESGMLSAARTASRRRRGNSVGGTSSGGGIGWGRSWSCFSVLVLRLGPLWPYLLSGPLQRLVTIRGRDN